MSCPTDRSSSWLPLTSAVPDRLNFKVKGKFPSNSLMNPSKVSRQVQFRSPSIKKRYNLFLRQYHILIESFGLKM